MMTAKIVPLLVTTKLVCSSCGAPGEGSCRCGAPYVPAKARVAAYDKAKPGRSTRQAAADLGVSNKTVSKARSSGVTQVTPAKVKGRDGKSYPAKPKPKQESSMKVEINQLLSEAYAIGNQAAAVANSFKTIVVKYPLEKEDEAKDAILHCFYETGELLIKLAQQME